MHPDESRNYCFLDFRWLVSSILDCFTPVEDDDELPPRLHPGVSSPELDEKSIEVYRQQPGLISPPRAELGGDRPKTSASQRASLWISEGRSLVHRASSRASNFSFSPRPRAQTSHSARRPTIGAPMDFRHVDGYNGGSYNVATARSVGYFRPLTLSIHVPANALSPLPTFSPRYTPEPAELQPPARAHLLHRTDSIFSTQSDASNFVIPRKPLPSSTRTSLDVPRLSDDTQSTVSSPEAEWIAYPLHPRPNHLASQSLPTLGTSVPDKEQLQPLTPPPGRSYLDPSFLHQRSGSEPHRLMPKISEEWRERPVTAGKGSSSRETATKNIQRINPLMQHPAGPSNICGPPAEANLSYPETRPSIQRSVTTVSGSRFMEEDLEMSNLDARESPKRSLTSKKVSNWLLRSVTSDKASAQTGLYQVGSTSNPSHRPRVSISTVSTLSSASDVLTPQTLSPDSSPGRHVSPRQRRFNYSLTSARLTDAKVGKADVAELCRPVYEGLPPSPRSPVGIAF